MGRLALNWVCVLALVALPVGGCGDETTATGGSGGAGGGAGGMAVPDLCAGVDCDDGLFCTLDRCRPDDGTCEREPFPAGQVPCLFEAEPVGSEDASIERKDHTDPGPGVCDGAGECVECVDDQNCAQDCVVGRSCNLAANRCEGGENAPPNTPCGVADHRVCNDAGACVTCNEDSQCDDFVDCTVDTCDTSAGLCNDPIAVVDGTLCAGGSCDDGQCVLDGLLMPCTDQGVRNAIAAGGGPYTFDCDGPTTIVSRGTFHINKDVILDGESNVIIDGSESRPPMLRVDRPQRVIQVALRGLALVDGDDSAGRSGVAGIWNSEVLALSDCTISGMRGTAIINDSILTMQGCTVSGNRGHATLLTSGRGNATQIINSTFAENSPDANAAVSRTFALGPDSSLSLYNCTVSGLSDDGDGIAIDSTLGRVVLKNTVVDGRCQPGSQVLSGGENIESPGNTCPLGEGGDQVDVARDDLKLGPLQDNGGPTQTRALGEGSVAIDAIREEACTDADGVDQRGFPRDSMCDVGAFEVQAGPTNECGGGRGADACP